MTRRSQDTFLPLSRYNGPCSSPSSRFKLGRPPTRWLAYLVCAAVGLWFAYPWLHAQYDKMGYRYQAPYVPGWTKGEISVPLRVTTEEKRTMWKARKMQVREAFLHAWKGYVHRAWPMDELESVSGHGSDKFNGWGVTVVDSLDTMWLMGLKEEFELGVTMVANTTFASKVDQKAPFFETTIRYLGGFLSAYALSSNSILLIKANELARKLEAVFDKHPTGFPSYSVNTETLGTGEYQDGMVLTAELGSCQLEYKYLAQLTGRAEYYTKVERIMDVLYNAPTKEGMFTDKWNPKTGEQVGGRYGVGALIDSAYEYMLKSYIQTGDLKALQQYLTSTRGIINNLLFVSTGRRLLYVTDIEHGQLTQQLEHLSCFFPGLLALGAHVIPEAYMDEKTREMHKWAAEGLTNTCWTVYADQITGLGPEVVKMANGGELWINEVRAWENKGRPMTVNSITGEPESVPPGVKDQGRAQSPQNDYYVSSPSYFLRPETVESIYLMWRTTGDESWREKGYSIFNSLQQHTKTPLGYTSLHATNKLPVRPTNDQPSYFLAETLKYLYLLFDDEDPINLKRWVFNTEAHPLPVYQWKAGQEKAFNITKPTWPTTPVGSFAL